MTSPATSILAFPTLASGQYQVRLHVNGQTDTFELEVTGSTYAWSGRGRQQFIPFPQQRGEQASAYLSCFDGPGGRCRSVIEQAGDSLNLRFQPYSLTSKPDRWVNRMVVDTVGPSHSVLMVGAKATIARDLQVLVYELLECEQKPRPRIVILFWTSADYASTISCNTGPYYNAE